MVTLLYLFPFIVGALACNLTEPPTPTFIPPPTFTVPPPIFPVTPTPTALPPTDPTHTPLPAGPTPDAAPAIPLDPNIALYLAQVDNDRLFIHVRELQDFGTRFVLASPNSTTQGIGGARAWIINQFRQIEQEARANAVPFIILPHTFALDWQETSTTQTNVLAYLPGTGDRVNEVIIVAAHYDSISEYADATSPAPGADGNASGVAVMLECARIMAQAQHRATVVFVAFAAEEVGLQGSAAFLADVVEGDTPLDVRAVINLDTVGAQIAPDGAVIADRVRVFSAQPNDSASRQLARSIQLIAADYVSDLAIDIQGTGDREGYESGHTTFSDAGYPAVRLMEAAEDPERNNSMRDTMERISTRYMARVARVTLAALLVLADGPAPPSDITQTDSGFRWTPPPSAAGYIIALRPADALSYERWFQIGATSSFVLSNADLAGTSYLAIAALDADGRQGPFSAELLIEH